VAIGFMPKLPDADEAGGDRGQSAGSSTETGVFAVAGKAGDVQ
jgi:hypothetical protein